MKRYVFEGIDSHGQFRKGLMQGIEKERIFLVLQKRGILPLSVKRFWNFFSLRKESDRKQVLIFFLYLEHSFLAGLSLVTAIGFLTQEIRGKWLLLIQDIRDQLEEGTSFSRALGGHPEFSDPVVLSLLKVGEETGAMGEILAHITTYLQKRQATQERLREALRYPLMIFFVLVFTMAVLMENLLPSMRELSQTLHLESRGMVRFFEGISNLFEKKGEIFLVGVGVFFGSIFLFWRKFIGKSFCLHGLFLKLPLWGTLNLHMAWGHFFEAWRLMILSGIPIAHAFQKSVRGVSHPLLKRFLEKSEKQLFEGERMPSLFLKAPGIKSFIHQLLVVGEKTGGFSGVLQQIVRLQEGEASRLEKHFLTFLQPFFLGFLGLFLLLIAMGTVIPLYETLPQISRGTL